MSQKMALPAANTKTEKWDLSKLNVLAKNPDVIMAISVIFIFLVILLPVPGVLLDLLLAISLSISVIILLMSLYVNKPLDFRSFPSVLLLSALFRLSLNAVTTKSILMHGHGTDAKLSRLIKAFGDVVVGGNFLVGLVVFIIIMIINFMVVTKGAGRVAEVAARFTLDAMPGKQMAIDAELNSGHINADEARKRRRAIEDEADFYGSMDGASKFVRGESIAGIIITLVNMIVGFIVGIVQHNMDASTSAKAFTLLAVGDGLVTAIPSLMISTSAGLIVTRATSESNLGTDIITQVRSHPKVFYWAGGLILALALFPGFPKIPFFALALAMFYIGKTSADKLAQEAAAALAATAQGENTDDKASNDIDSLMKVDALSVEVGHALVSLIDPSEDGEVVERIQSLRKQFAQDLGIIIPQVQLRDNLQLDPGHYAILIKGNKVAGGQLMTDYYLAMDPGTVEVPINAETIPDPVYGMPAMWVHSRNKDDAVFRGYTVVNCSTVIATHLTKILREHAAELITRQDIQYLVDKLKETNPKVVDEVLSAERLALGDVVKVFQNLLREDVSVKDILTLFECLADHAKYVKNPDVLSELCRKALGRTIVSKLLDPDQRLLSLVFDRVIEDLLAAALVLQDNGTSYLNLDARMAQDILNKISKAVEVFNTEGVQPVLLVSARIRQPLYKITSRYLSALVLISYDEVPSDIQIKTLEVIS